MTEPKPDIARLRRVLAKIDAEPETWDQRTYAIRKSCGTACCIAGHAVVDAGHKIAFENYDVGEYIYETAGGEYIEELAADLLKLTYDEHSALFDSGNTREDIQHVAEQIAARAGETL